MGNYFVLENRHYLLLLALKRAERTQKKEPPQFWYVQNKQIVLYKLYKHVCLHVFTVLSALMSIGSGSTQLLL